MKANKHVGEIGIASGGRDYVFRPSFYALAQIGDEKELVDIYNRLAYSGFNEFVNALNILSACYTGEDKSDLFKLLGFFKDVKGRLRFVLGAVPVDDIYTLASILMQNGMIGRPKKTGQGEESKTFSPAEYVGAANAHFGIQPDQAWKMTMIEFQQSMYAKYPDIAGKEDYPTADEHAELVRMAEEALARMGSKK